MEGRGEKLSRQREQQMGKGLAVQETEIFVRVKQVESRRSNRRCRDHVQEGCKVGWVEGG